MCILKTHHSLKWQTLSYAFVPFSMSCMLVVFIIIMAAAITTIKRWRKGVSEQERGVECKNMWEKSKREHSSNLFLYFFWEWKCLHLLSMPHMSNNGLKKNAFNSFIFGMSYMGSMGSSLLTLLALQYSFVSEETTACQRSSFPSFLSKLFLFFYIVQFRGSRVFKNSVRLFGMIICVENGLLLYNSQ